MKDQSNINNNFASARKEIKYLLGIDLTLIELVELKKDVEFTTDIYLKDIKNFNVKNKEDPKLIRPDFEAVLMFMNRNYGTQMYNGLYGDYQMFGYIRWKTEKLVGFDYYPEYFKRVQEKMHFP